MDVSSFYYFFVVDVIIGDVLEYRYYRMLKFIARANLRMNTYCIFLFLGGNDDDGDMI